MIDACLARGVPSSEACDAGLSVLLTLAPLLGSLEHAVLQIALALAQGIRAPPLSANDASKVGLAAADEKAPPTRGFAYFEAASALQREIEQLATERDAALRQLTERRREVATTEAALSQARSQLAEHARRIDQVLREQAAMSSHVALARSQRERWRHQFEEHLSHAGHVSRANLGEQGHLQSRIAELHEERANRERDMLRLAASPSYHRHSGGDGPMEAHLPAPKTTQLEVPS